jgi:hypothetical protein
VIEELSPDLALAMGAGQQETRWRVFPHWQWPIARFCVNQSGGAEALVFAHLSGILKQGFVLKATPAPIRAHSGFTVTLHMSPGDWIAKKKTPQFP